MDWSEMVVLADQIFEGRSMTEGVLWLQLHNDDEFECYSWI